jgi:hypothetical protein
MNNIDYINLQIVLLPLYKQITRDVCEWSVDRNNFNKEYR